MADKLTQEEAFRSSLQDAIVVMKRLSSLSDNLPDLIGMAELALENDAQFRLMMKLILEKK